MKKNLTEHGKANPKLAARFDKSLKTKPGYHLVEIPKGKLGESSKILEEVLELIDAEKQGAKIMAIIELSDLVGAIQAYLQANAMNVELKDLEKMASITKRAFDNGRRL